MPGHSLCKNVCQIENLDPTFPKGKRHDGRKSRRAARRNRFCPQGGEPEDISSSSSSSSEEESSSEESSSEEEEEAKEQESLWCEVCNRVFASAQALASHKKSARHQHMATAAARQSSAAAAHSRGGGAGAGGGGERGWAQGAGRGGRGAGAWARGDKAGGKSWQARDRDHDVLGTVGGHASCVSRSGSGIVKTRLPSQLVRYADAVGMRQGGRGADSYPAESYPMSNQSFSRDPQRRWNAGAEGSSAGFPRASDLLARPPQASASHASHFTHASAVRPLNGHNGFAGGGGRGERGDVGTGGAGGAGPGGRSQEQLVEYWFGRPAPAAAATAGVGGKQGTPASGGSPLASPLAAFDQVRDLMALCAVCFC